VRLYRHISEVPPAARGTVVALGNFDGLHRGHQHVLGTAGRIAQHMNCGLTVLLFEPHPVHFFRPDLPNFRLTPARERLQLLDHFGIDQALLLPFDAHMAAMSAQDFVLDVLVGGLGALHVVVGYDYRFGHKRGGGTDVLAYMGEMEGFGLSVIDPVCDHDADSAFSSTRIRKALQAGDPRAAADMLGHWWGINGRVIKGDQRGRTIGFPTANLQLGESIEPRLGVYAVRVRIEEEAEMYAGVANLGRRPTFDKKDVLLEVHLFDCDRDLYGLHMRVELVDFIRQEQKFNGLEALTAQIAADRDRAGTLLALSDHAQQNLRRPTLARWLDENPE